MKYLSSLIILSTLYLVLSSAFDLHRRISDIDSLGQMLYPVRQKITAASVIGFDSNDTEVVRLHELYYKTVFALAPSLTVWSQKKTQVYDTLLTVSDLSFPAKKYDAYRCIDKGQQDGFTYSLLVLNK